MLFRSRQLCFFIGPGFLVFVGILLIPLLCTFLLSFFESSSSYFSLTELQYVGFKHFSDLLQDTTFLHATYLLLLFVSISTCIEMLIAFSVAYYLDQIIKLPKFVHTMLILPMFVLPIVSGLSFRYLFDPENGIIASIFFRFGLEAPDFLGSQWGAFFLIVIQDVWRMWPFLFMILFAGFANIPKNLLEAARLDGANLWQQCRFVIFPHLKHTLIIALVLKVIESFKAFTEIFCMTGGGPGDATNILSLFIVKQVTDYHRFGYGSAASLVLLFISISIIITFAYLQNSKKKLPEGSYS